MNPLAHEKAEPARKAARKREKAVDVAMRKLRMAGPGAELADAVKELMEAIMEGRSWKLSIGEAERETRRGSYWTVPIMVKSETGEDWYCDVIATAQGDTREQALRRARFIRDRLQAAFDMPRLHGGLLL